MYTCVYLWAYTCPHMCTYVGSQQFKEQNNYLLNMRQS